MHDPWCAVRVEDKAMYASLRHYRIEPKNMDELLRRVPGAMDVISKIHGFKGLLRGQGGGGHACDRERLHRQVRSGAVELKLRRGGSRRTLRIFTAARLMR